MARIEVKNHGGVPTIHVDGRPFLHNHISAIQRLRTKFPEKFRDLDYPLVQYAFGSWAGPEDYEFEKADQVNAEVFREHPDKLALMSIPLTPPARWLDQHPAEL